MEQDPGAGQGKREAPRAAGASSHMPAPPRSTRPPARFLPPSWCGVQLPLLADTCLDELKPFSRGALQHLGLLSKVGWRAG